MTVYKRRIDIHIYYNQEHRVNRFKKILREIEIEHVKTVHFLVLIVTNRYCIIGKVV